jgi:hypothetical protein
MKFISWTIAVPNKRMGLRANLLTEDQLENKICERNKKQILLLDAKKSTEILIERAIDVDAKRILSGEEAEKTLV